MKARPPSVTGKQSRNIIAGCPAAGESSKFRKVLTIYLLHPFGISELLSGTRRLLRDGLAMPMRGQSVTCRQQAYSYLQVSDLLGRSQTANALGAGVRQVGDLPRISMAEPSRTDR